MDLPFNLETVDLLDHRLDESYMMDYLHSQEKKLGMNYSRVLNAYLMDDVYHHINFLRTDVYENYIENQMTQLQQVSKREFDLYQKMLSEIRKTKARFIDERKNYPKNFFWHY